MAYIVLNAVISIKLSIRYYEANMEKVSPIPRRIPFIYLLPGSLAT